MFRINADSSSTHYLPVVCKYTCLLLILGSLLSCAQSGDDNEASNPVAEQPPVDSVPEAVPMSAAFTFSWSDYCGADSDSDSNPCTTLRNDYKSLERIVEKFPDGKDVVINLGLAPFYEPGNGQTDGTVNWQEFYDGLLLDNGATQASKAEAFALQVIAWEAQYNLNIYIQIGNEIMVGHGSPIDEQAENQDKDKFGQLCLVVGIQDDPDCRVKVYANYIFEPVQRGIARTTAKVMMGSVSNLGSAAKQQVFEAILRTKLGADIPGLNANVNGRSVYELVHYSSGHYIGGDLEQLETVYNLTKGLGITGHFQTEEAGRRVTEVGQGNSGAAIFLGLFSRNSFFIWKNKLTRDQFRYMTWGTNISEDGSKVSDAAVIIQSELGDRKIEKIESFEEGTALNPAAHIYRITARQDSLFQSKELVSVMGDRDVASTVSKVNIANCTLPSNIKIHLFSPGSYEQISGNYLQDEILFDKPFLLENHLYAALISYDCN